MTAAFDDPVLLAVAVLDGDDVWDALWDACGCDACTWSHALIAAQAMRRSRPLSIFRPEFKDRRCIVEIGALVSDRNPPSPPGSLLDEPRRAGESPTARHWSRSPLPTVRVEQRRPARHPLRAGLIDDVLIVTSTVVGAAWIAVCAAALTRLTTGG